MYIPKKLSNTFYQNGITLELSVGVKYAYAVKRYKYKQPSLTGLHDRSIQYGKEQYRVYLSDLDDITRQSLSVAVTNDVEFASARELFKRIKTAYAQRRTGAVKIEALAKEKIKNKEE